jgi:hypothetical protein
MKKIMDLSQAGTFTIALAVIALYAFIFAICYAMWS